MAHSHSNSLHFIFSKGEAFRDIQAFTINDSYVHVEGSERIDYVVAPIGATYNPNEGFRIPKAQLHRFDPRNGAHSMIAIVDYENGKVMHRTYDVDREVEIGRFCRTETVVENNVEVRRYLTPLSHDVLAYWVGKLSTNGVPKWRLKLHDTDEEIAVLRVYNDKLDLKVHQLPMMRGDILNGIMLTTLIMHQ